MARKLRIQYPGALYHLMNRGDRREAIFKDDQDYDGFLKTLAEACQKSLWQVGSSLFSVEYQAMLGAAVLIWQSQRD